MSKYQPLTDYLLNLNGREVRLSFDDIEEILGFTLPGKSKVIRAWWSNNPSNNVMTKAWLIAGYKSAQVDVAGERLSFVPTAPSGFSESSPKYPDSSGKRHPLFGMLKGTTIVAPGVDLTAPTWPLVTEGEPKKPGRHPAWGAMKGTFALRPDVDLTEPADPEWGKVYED